MIDRRILVLLLGILLGISTLSASAQTPAANQIPAEEDLTGLQAAVGRSYMPAGTFIGEAVINIDEATPVSSPPDTPLPAPIIVVVREFDSADNAAVAHERISAGVEASMPNVFSDGTQKITSEALPDIGSRATLIRVKHTEPGVTVWTETAVVQRDRYVFLVTATAMGSVVGESEPADTSLPTADIAAAVASGEPSPDEPTFVDDGTSTGGLWGFMLPAGDPLLMGLVPIQDFIVYPDPGA